MSIISKKTLRAVTSSESCFTNSISNKTSTNSQPSKTALYILRNSTTHYQINFEKLEPTLRALQIHFNSNTVQQIMEKQQGIAILLLYQIKMVLEKVYPPADIRILAKTGKVGDNQPALKMAKGKPKYDQVSHDFFK